jgi:pimeloyl-ACP methyl ester carboxylesterase
MKSTIKRKTDKGDWFVKTITVNTVRKQSEIGPQTIQMPGISILSHPDFKADLSLTAMGGNTRSLRLGGQLNQRIDGEEAQILNFAGTRSTLQNQSIFELSGMEKPESLKEHPLKIKIDAEVANGAAVFPVTLKEDFIIPFGTPLLQEDGSVLLEIDELPKDTDLLPTKPGTRSPGRAIWFSLLKMAGLEERVFLLRKVVYNDGIGARVALGEEDIKNANRILLITHGIIGDTKTMIKNLEFLLTEKHYDLLICFDYENLNTPIESIAEKLDEALKEVGIDENHQKTFHILCHSMGGLVSRYLIEHLHSGEDLVEHLFMFGTPNGGSVFGEIPAFRDRLIQLLTVALNFSKGWSPWVATALGLTNKVLVGSKPLTKTLAQMSGKSKFIKGLKKTGPISTQYSIIAGDISAYKSIKDKRLARLIEMVLLKIGDLANGEPNDIAVKVKDIRRIPKNIESYKSNICCHHLNYFDSEEGVNKLKQVISKK